MAKEVKKQHYVPRCYLKAFLIEGTKKIHVFDKRQRTQRINNYEDIASSNHFYDFSVSECQQLSDHFAKAGYKVNVNPQGIELYFATTIHTYPMQQMQWFFQIRKISG